MNLTGIEENGVLCVLVESDERSSRTRNRQSTC